MTNDTPDGDAPASVASELGLHGRQRRAVAQSYDVTRRYLAPFVVDVAARMLDDLREEQALAPTRRIALVGRDGTSLGLAIRQLDPEFFRAHCVDITVSRVIIETAMQDREAQGVTFPALQAYRRATAPRVRASTTSGAFQQLRRYLRDTGIPVGRQGSQVTLVDSSYKGTIQELLQALYPDTRFTGKYVAFAASPDDRHPGSKQGYALHLEHPDSFGGLPVAELPSDPALTFACQDALASIEYTLNGPLASPSRLRGDRPQQTSLRHDPDPLAGLDARLVAPAFRDALTREGCKRASQLAVDDVARAIAAVRDSGGDWRSLLANGRARFVHHLRAWLRGGPEDRELGQVLDAFVVRRRPRPPAWRVTDYPVGLPRPSMPSTSAPAADSTRRAGRPAHRHRERAEERDQGY